MKTASNLQKVSLLFFFILGILQILGGIWATQGEYLPISLIVHRILDIPFAITGLIYGCSTIHHHATPTHKKGLSIFFSILVIGTFITLIGINLLIPDRII